MWGSARYVGAVRLSCFNVESCSLVRQSQSEYQRQGFKIIMGELSTVREYRVNQQTHKVVSISVGKRPLQIFKKASNVVPTVKITMLSPSQGSLGYFSAAKEYWKKGIMCYYLNKSPTRVLANVPPSIFLSQAWRVICCRLIKPDQDGQVLLVAIFLFFSPINDFCLLLF